VTSLTVATKFAEMPWRSDDSTSLTPATKDTRVDHRKTAERRKTCIEHMIDPPGLPAVRQEKQLELMVPILQRMAAGMSKALARLMSKKYGSMFSLPEHGPELDHLAKIPATSDSIERYFGLPSWLKKSDENKTKINLNHTLNIIETQAGTRMMEAYLEDPEGVAQMIAGARAFVPVHEATLQKRGKQTLEDKINGYKEAERVSEEKRVEKEKDMDNMLVEAMAWKHLPMLPARRSGGGGGSITAEVKRIEGGEEVSATKKTAAVTAWAYRWLCVFKTVFDLDDVAELRGVFFGASGKRGIKTGRTVEQLVHNVAACSLYMDGHALHFKALKEKLQVDARARREQTAPPSTSMAGSPAV